MSYNKQFYSTYKSMNGWDYHLEIFVNGYTGSATEVSLANTGCVISYECNSDDRYNPILPSTMTIPFLVSNSTEADFITALREDYEDNDVYVYLYQSSSANERQLWAGWLLLDLGSEENLYYPYQINLNATDGLALLKDKDFVDTTDQAPYEKADLYQLRKRVSSWIARILEKVPIPLATDGAYENYEYRTCMNWYNDEMSAVAQDNDPLYNMQFSVFHFYNKDQGSKYSAPSSYEVLKEILRAIGCRMLYWQGIYWVIQIDTYNTANTGTLAAPINNSTRSYTRTGAQDTDFAYVGTTTLSRYQLDIASGSGGIQLLKGSRFTFLPKVKRAFANFICSNENHYTGFVDSANYPTPGNQTIIDLGTIADLDTFDNLHLSTPLSTSHTAYTEPYQFTIYFTFKATNGSTDYYLKKSGGSWIWHTSNWSLEQDAPQIHTPTISSGDVLNWTGFSKTIPSESWMSGDWDYSIIVEDDAFLLFYTTVGGGFTETIPTGLSWQNIPSENGTINTSTTSSTIMNPTLGFGTSTTITYSSTSGNPFAGVFLGLNATGGVQSDGTQYNVEAVGDDSYTIDMGTFMFGDSIGAGAASKAAIKVYDGSAWVYTEISGGWGRNTTSGTSTITNLLLIEFIQGQGIVNTTDTNRVVKVLNGTIVVSEENKSQTDGSGTRDKFVNPVGRLSYDGLNYVFRRGSFRTALDEWDYEGFQIFRNT